MEKQSLSDETPDQKKESPIPDGILRLISDDPDQVDIDILLQPNFSSADKEKNLRESNGCGPNISLEQLMTKRALTLAAHFKTGNILGEGINDDEAMTNMANNGHNPESDGYYFYAVPAELKSTEN